MTQRKVNLQNMSCMYKKKLKNEMSNLVRCSPSFHYFHFFHEIVFLALDQRIGIHLQTKKSNKTSHQMSYFFQFLIKIHYVFNHFPKFLSNTPLKHASPSGSTLFTKACL